MSKNIVFEGWLTKSPPSKRIWRTKWRRRWFALRQSGELPGQYFLDYYADRNCRRPKGTINLDLCEQVDAGLHMERTGNGSLDPKLRGSVFTIQTQSRTYHLEADCEAEMAKWVDAICRVCGLRATDEPPNEMETYQITINDHYECGDGTGPYIPISECITGVRAQDHQQAFTFDTKNILISATVERGSDNRSRQVYTSQPHTRQNNSEFSDNESTPSDDDCKSLNTSQSNIPDCSVAKSLTKLTISSDRSEFSEEGPPVPPRPPKTFAKYREVQRETFQGPKFQEPIATNDNINIQGQSVTWLRVPRQMPYGGAPSSPGRSLNTPVAMRSTDDEDDFCQVNLSMQYYNLPSLPPAVDRALKPRYSSHIPHVNQHMGQSGLPLSHHDEVRASNVLQYLDLDLHTSAPEPSTSQEASRIPIIHGKSMSAIEADYKTVDFLKTEAFNITRQDAEAFRSNPK